MVSKHIIYPTAKKEFYQCIQDEIASLTYDIPHLVSNLANISALLGSALKDINWIGFYLIPACFPNYFPLDKIKGSENHLVVGPFQGLPACIEIPVGKGVCGAAVEKDDIMLIPDVHLFPGHIACDSASNSEIVLPIHNQNGKVVAVLDIDSPLLGRFDEEDKEGLIKVVKAIEQLL